MADFTILNATAAELTDVNAGGTDVPAWSKLAGVTLTGAELLVVAAINGVAVMQDASTAAERSAVAAFLLDDLSDDLDLSTARLREVFGESREELKLVRNIVRAA